MSMHTHFFGNFLTISMFINLASALNLANMLRVDTSTGLTALRMQDGLAQRNSSVDDFLSLVASGDIPPQDPHMLNVPLQNVLQQQQGGNSTAAQLLAHQHQLLAHANGGGNMAMNRYASLGSLNNGNNPALSNSNSIGDHIASLGGLRNHNSAASLLSQYVAAQQGSNSDNSRSHQGHSQHQQENGLKRKYNGDMGGDEMGPNKR